MTSTLNPSTTLARLIRTIFLTLTGFLLVANTRAQQIIWTGAGTNSTPGNTNWSSSVNWSGGTPGPATSVFFFDPGATANGVSNIDNIVDTSQTIYLLKYGNTNNSHTTLINSGITLTVSNSAATNLVYVGTGTDNGVSQVVDATITGKTGTLLVVDTNTSSAMQLQQGSSAGGSHDAILDLSGLGTFNLTAGRLLIAGSPASGVNASNYLAGLLNLANTNLIVLNGATSPQLVVGDAISNPNSLTNFLQLGQTNSLYADNITIGRGKQIGIMRFNPAFSANNPVLYLRGKSATQVATLAIADNGAQTGTSSASTGTVDLSLGTVNAQVNTCILARGQIAATSTGGANGLLNLAAGVFNVNTLEAGVVNTNNAEYTVSGIINVTGTATLVINTDLALGTNPNTNFANVCYAKGTLNVTNGAVYANAITSPSTSGVIGTINVNNGSLTISNTAGTSVTRLASLNFTSASLHLDASNPGQTNIVTTNLTGTATIYIDSIGYAGGTMTYPLISYLGSDPYNNLTLASLGAYTGSLVDNSAAKRIDLQITSGPVTPILGSIVWGGGVNNLWDTSSLNWTNSGATTVYADTDLVNFNDLGRTGSITLNSTVAPGSVTVSNTALAYTISGTGAISGSGPVMKAGTGTMTLANTNTYTGNTFVSGGLLNLATPVSLPSASAINLTGASNATLNLEGWSQTVANLITTNNAVVSSTGIITGTLNSALIVSPALLTLSPFHVTNTMNLNMAGLGSFTYNNSAGTVEVRVGVVSPGGVNATSSGVQTTVTLSGQSNSITAGSLNMGNNSPAGGTPIAQLNLGTNNVFNVNTINLGSARGGDTIQFASGVTGGTLTIAGASPGSLATINYAGHDSFEANDSPIDVFNTTAGTLNAQLNTMTIGQDSPTPNMSNNRGINGNSSFKMGAGTLTASSITLGVVNNASGDNGSYYYSLTNTSLFSVTNGGTVTVTNLTLAVNNYTGNLNPSLASRLAATVSLAGGATLYTANLQEGSLAAPNEGTLSVIPELLWGNGTLCNIPGGGLTVNGVDVVLAGAATINISSGQSGLVNAWISGTGSLTDTGAGALVLDGQNYFNGPLIMASTNSLTLGSLNTYTGNTVISNGTVFVTGSDSLMSPNIILASNTTFDVSEVAPFTLGANTNQNLTGYGSVNGSFMVNSGSQIIPGGAGTAGTLTFSNDLTLNGATTYFDLSSSPAGNNDQINLGGNLNLYANATIWINMLNGTLAPGTYTLMTYSGLNQNGYNFVLVAPRGVTLNAGPTALTLSVTTINYADLTWVGDGSANNWDVQTTTNWLNDGNLDYFYQLDNVTFNDTGSDSPAVNLATILAPSSVTVNAAENYTFTSYEGGQLVGAMTLAKGGTGTLFLETSNAYTGGTTISNGTVEMDIAGAAGTGNVNIGTNSLNVNIGNSTLANNISGSGAINLMTMEYSDLTLGGALSNFTGVVYVPADPYDTTKIIINSPTVDISSKATINVTSGGTFYATGSGVIIAATNLISGGGNGDVYGALRVDSNAVIAGPIKLLGSSVIGSSGNVGGTISGVISDGGSGYGLTMVGDPTATIFLLASNTYSGGTTVSNGLLSIGNGLVNGSLPAMPLSVTNYATLQFDVVTNTTVTPLQQILGPGVLSKVGDGILSLTVSNGFSGGFTSGNGAGNGSSGGITYVLNPYAFGDPSLSATVAVNRAEVRFTGGMTVATNVYFQTSANSALAGPGGGYVAFHNISGTNTIPNAVELVTGAGNSEFESDAGLLVFSGPILLGNTSARTAIFSGAGNGLVSGPITNAATVLSIQKNGTGIWTLTGANTYTGTTTVTGGSLLVNSTTGTGAVTVQSGGTLGGSGTISVATTVQNGGAIQGGDGNYENTLSVASLNLGSTGTDTTYSRFTVATGGEVSATSLNVTGTDVVQILDPSLTVGTNTLFNYTGTIGGSSGFAGFQLGTLPAGVTAQLLNTGSAVQLAVTSVQTVNTNPPVMTNILSGNTLTLSWPANHLGWRLEVQTNSLNNGIGATWYTVPNSTNVTSVPITLNPGNPTVFFRLVYP